MTRKRKRDPPNPGKRVQRSFHQLLRQKRQTCSGCGGPVSCVSTCVKPQARKGTRAGLAWL